MNPLAVEFLGRTVQTPLVLASGIWGTSALILERAAQNGFGAVTTKSCGPEQRRGHVNPTCIDWGHGLINAVGLANPGIDAEIEPLTSASDTLSAIGVPLIASIFAGTPAEFGEVAAKITVANPAFIELNISCPNVASEFGEPFAASADAAAAVTSSVKAAIAGSDIPIIVKLAPNVPSIARIACAVVHAGADALCATNTMPGMLVDAESGQPVLANRTGGISGHALKPIALKCVYDIYRACPGVPIIGTGGISTGLDVVEFIMAGSSVVGVGSAIYYRGLEAGRQIISEVDQWLREHEIDNISELRGRAHEVRTYDTSPSPPPDSS